MALVTSSEIISTQSSIEQAGLYGAMNFRNRAALSAFYFSQREHRLVNTNQFLAEPGCSYIKNIKETYNPDINQEKLSCSSTPCM